MRFMAAILFGAALLGGCASMPASRHAAAAAQPLQHLTVVPVVPDDDVLAMKLAGQFALESGDVAAAAREFARAAARSDDADLANEAVEVAIAAKDWDLARSGIARWQQLRADDPALWQWRARVALHDGKPDDALADLRSLARQPDAKGWSAIGRVLLASENKAQAGALLRKLATPEALGKKSATWVAVSELADHLGAKALTDTLAKDAITRFGDAPAYVWGAELKLKEGDKSGARALFVEALKRNAADTHLRAAYATVLGQMGDNAEAARVLAIGKQDDYTYAARAAYAARADDKVLIASLYRELLAAKTPRNGARLTLLGELAELLHKSAALTWYEKVPTDDERWPQAQLRSALLLDQAGHTARALGLLHRLQARSGDDDKQVGDAYLMEAEILDRRRRGEEAVAVYDRGLQALPDDPRLLYARALLNDDLDHIDAAVRDLRRLLALQPDNADALNALGYTLADRTRDQAEALTLIEKALALRPDEPAIIDSMGWVQYRLGHLKQAVERLRTAYAKQPDPEIAAHLGEVLWVSGEKDAARKIWAQGQKKDAKNKVLLETMKRLES
ncbi:MAG: tetratricopeptide repeat protein [Xanthomonadaceae bacterium]|nr:tetratricopeptide repeat protein [Xanthomonadaceae bacterium]